MLERENLDEDIMILFLYLTIFKASTSLTAGFRQPLEDDRYQMIIEKFSQVEQRINVLENLIEKLQVRRKIVHFHRRELVLSTLNFGQMKKKTEILRLF